METNAHRSFHIRKLFIILRRGRQGFICVAAVVRNLKKIIDINYHLWKILKKLMLRKAIKRLFHLLTGPEVIEIV